MFSISNRRKRLNKNVQTNNNATLNKNVQTNNNATLNKNVQTNNNVSLNKNEGISLITNDNNEKKHLDSISLKLDKVKQEDLSFRDFVQKNESEEIKYNKQKRIEEDNKYKLWVKSQE